MKRLAVFSLLFAGIVTAVSAAVPQQRRGQATTQSAPAAGATAARSAVSARSATARSAAPAPTATTAARSATRRSYNRCPWGDNRRGADHCFRPRRRHPESYRHRDQGCRRDKEHRCQRSVSAEIRRVYGFFLHVG